MSNLLWDNASRDTLFSVGQTRYLARPSQTDIPFAGHEDGTLVTVFDVPDQASINVTQEWIKDTLTRYEKDDVFQKRFLSGIVFHGVEADGSQITASAREYLKKAGAEWIQGVPRPSSKFVLRPGPYVLLDGHLRDVWRLYNDNKGNFMASLVPDQDSFKNLDYKSSEDSFLAIAVPSRLRFRGGSHPALNGLRFAVKDNYHVAGIKTSLGSKAYFDTFPPQPKTAECIQTILDHGGVLLGKTKMNSLGTWEEPTEYIDYQAPWNSRADGFQGTGGSSTGSAAAMANYDWIDLTLGSDTWGSIMRPALWSGTFGFRPTYDAASREGLDPSIPFLDMPAFLGRNLLKCREFASSWLKKEKLVAHPKPFTAVKWASDFWGYIDSNQVEIAESFVKDIESQLGLKHVKVSFVDEWAKSPPLEAEGLSLDAYMVPAAGWTGYIGYHSSDKFREKHIEKFGLPPYVSPPNRKNWEAAKAITENEAKEAVSRIDVYRDWFRAKILEGPDSNVMLVLPIENLLPRYRDEPPTFKRPPSGVNSLFLSPVMKAPELVIPVGEIPYISKITEREERLPFGLGLMTPPGTDLQLLQSAQEILEKAGRPTEVATGRSMWPGKK